MALVSPITTLYTLHGEGDPSAAAPPGDPPEAADPFPMPDDKPALASKPVLAGEGE